MAVTISSVKHISLGNARMVIFNVVGPADYTTGGEALTLAQQRQVMSEVCGATQDWTKVLMFRSKLMCTTTPLGLQAGIDRSGAKMLFFQAGATAGEVALHTNLSAQTVVCELIYDPANAS